MIVTLELKSTILELLAVDPQKLSARTTFYKPVVEEVEEEEEEEEEGI